jgi:uncharacterized protein YdaU (DUF1376 family)
MSLADRLENPEVFKKMLTAFTSDQDDQWESLRCDSKIIERFLRQFSTKQ